MKRFIVRLAIAESFGIDSADVENDHRYQDTRTPCAVYTFGNGYYTATNSPTTLLQLVLKEIQIIIGFLVIPYLVTYQKTGNYGIQKPMKILTDETLGVGVINDVYEIKVTKIKNRYYARLFKFGDVISEMSCEYRIDIGYICSQMMRDEDKIGGNMVTSASRGRLNINLDNIKKPVGKIWYKK